MQDAACRQKQKPFEQCVVQDVEDRTCESKQGDAWKLVGEPEHAEPDPERDDADVLDAGVGQHALQVLLREREEDAEDAGR